MSKKRKLDDFYNKNFNYKKYITIRISFTYEKNYFNLSVPAKLLYQYIKSDPNDMRPLNDIFFNFAITDGDRETLKNLIDELYENNLVNAIYKDCTGHIEELQNNNEHSD